VYIPLTINLLLIDNYDSFTYNLVQYFGELGATLQVFEHDKISLAEIAALNPDYLCISPGPGHPRDAGISCSAIRHFAGKIPILGVCLGHQCIAEVFGGAVVKAARQLHGKTSSIHHNNRDLFKNLPNPFSATRYHSLIVDREKFPDTLEITAVTVEEGSINTTESIAALVNSEDRFTVDAGGSSIMGLRHRELPIWGIQFHPESILTTCGKELLRNFLSLK